MTERRTLETRNGRVIELVHRPECVSLPLGRVWFDGRTGIHEGDGRIRVYGDGEHYGYQHG